MKRVHIRSSLFIITGLAFQSCHNNKNLVEKSFIDSLQTLYTPDSLLASNERILHFWQDRISPTNPGNINELQYAGTLINRFKLAGHIQDLDSANAILKKVDTTFAHTLAAPLMSLVSLSIMRHRFAEGDIFYKKACTIGIKAYQKNAIGFDIAFELGYYGQAGNLLKNMSGLKDYNYYFRRSKI